jgi:hypothetical protein
MLIDQHGEDAPSWAVQKADAALESGTWMARGCG